MSNQEPNFESAKEHLADSLLSEHARLGAAADQDLIDQILAATVHAGKSQEGDDRFRRADSVSERVADSLVSEHARLGSESDVALVDSILTATVNAPRPELALVQGGLPTAAERPRFGASNWAVVSGSVAAAVALTFVVLSQLSVQKNQGPGQQHSDTFHFVVTMQNSESEGAVLASSVSAKHESIPARPFVGKGEVVAISDAKSQFASLDSQDTGKEQSPMLDEFGPSIAELPARPARVESVTVFADASKLEGDKRQYQGNVRLSHELFNLEADQLEIELDRETGILTARGELELSLPNGERRTLDPLREELILSGSQFSIAPTTDVEIYAAPPLQSAE